MEYLSIDPVDGPGVDVVADAATVELDGYDCVVCCEVLEHHPKPQELVEAAARALKPGGLFLMTCAGPGRAPHSAIDGGTVRPGEHYANVSPGDMDRALRDADFSTWLIDQYGPDLRCAAWR